MPATKPQKNKTIERGANENANDFILNPR